MIHQECFLKPNVMAEPLVDDWYAWARLIPTTTLARNLAERHLRIMDSYIQSPETHQAAVKDPRLLGGPFMDLDGNRLDFEETRFDRGSITAILFLGEHGDLNVLTQSAYLVRIGTHSLVFAPDSCSISPKLYEHVHRETGDIDALFLGMECDGAPVSWIYGPLFTQRMHHAKDHCRRVAGSNYDWALGPMQRDVRLCDGSSTMAELRYDYQIH